MSNSFYSRKIHSLLGVIPIGFFLVEHFITNYYSTRGNAEFVSQAEWIHGLPFILLLEIFLVWLPLLYHGVYGLYIAYQARNNPTQYGYVRNWMFTLQRVTGVATLLFIVWHFYETRFQVSLGNVEIQGLGELMHDILTNPVYFTLYVIGVLAATFHFCNGMWSFLVSWGITVGPRAQKVSSYVWMVAFVLLAALGIYAMIGFTDPDFFTKGVESIG